LVLLVQLHHAHAVIPGARLEPKGAAIARKLIPIGRSLLLLILLLCRLAGRYVLLAGTSGE
jgi:hypothetical protein